MPSVDWRDICHLQVFLRPHNNKRANSTYRRAFQESKELVAMLCTYHHYSTPCKPNDARILEALVSLLHAPVIISRKNSPSARTSSGNYR